MNKENKEQMNFNKIAVQLKKITKIFPNGTLANQNIDFDLHYGEIHALFGENGAGKSTLIKILFGNLTPTSGEIFLNGQKIFNHNPKISQEFGMAVVHQHFALIDNFSIFENVILGFETKNEQKKTKIQKEYYSKLEILNKQKAIKIEKIETQKNLPPIQKTKEIQKIKIFYDEKILHLNAEKHQKIQSFFCYDQNTQKDVEAIIKKFDLGLNLNDIVSNVGITKKQKTEILRVLFRKAKVIFFDESTSTIAPSDIKVFLKFLIQCKKENKAIVFISHKIKEIQEVADRITVLNKGKVVGSFKNGEKTEEELIKLMIGDKRVLPISSIERKSFQGPKTKVLSIKNLNLNFQKKQLLKNINLDLYAGEVVALFGFEENGQRKLLESISKIENKWNGNILFVPNVVSKNQKQYVLKKIAPHDVKNLGISYIPQDRQKEGILINDSLYLNTFFNNLYNNDWFSFGFIKPENILKRTQQILKKYNVYGASYPEQPINSLSGGNQQKFIIGRELETLPQLFLIDDPTWGIDAGMINFLSLEFIKMRNAGKTIFFNSPDLDLILSLADRVFVIQKGQIVGEVNPNAVDARTKIGSLIAKEIKEIK